MPPPDVIHRAITWRGKSYDAEPERAGGARVTVAFSPTADTRGPYRICADIEGPPLTSDTARAVAAMLIDAANEADRRNGIQLQR